MSLLYLLVFVLAFLLFWLFGDVILYLVLIGVIGTFIILKGVKRHRFIYLEVILLGVYLILIFCCLVFVGLKTLKVFLVVIGLWFICAVFFQKRL